MHGVVRLTHVRRQGNICELVKRHGEIVSIGEDTAIVETRGGRKVRVALAQIRLADAPSLIDEVYQFVAERAARLSQRPRRTRRLDRAV